MADPIQDGLIPWLLEQVDEDERVAGALAADGYPKHDNRVLSVEGTMDVPWPDRWNPTQVLAECEAKRKIIDDCRDEYEPGGVTSGSGLARRTLIAYGAMYAAAGREGYLPEWSERDDDD